MRSGLKPFVSISKITVLDAGDDFIQVNWLVVCMFHTDVDVVWVVNQVLMDMAVNTNTPIPELLDLERDVYTGKPEFVKPTPQFDLLEITV